MARTAGSQKLHKFLELKGISMRKAGEDLGVADPTVLDWRRGRKSPKPEHRTAIRIWTNGEIAESDWQTKSELKKAARAENVKPFEESGDDDGHGDDVAPDSEAKPNGHAKETA
jgi:transcriptional regulator with XRE-family HTH domain